MVNPIHTLIFDLDGTLVDSSESILSCFSAALSTLGITPAMPLTAAIIGPPLRATLSLLAGTQDEQLLDRLSALFMAHYDSQGYKATRVFPGIPEMLERKFSEGIALHLATNKRQRPTQLILEHLGWSKWFKSVYSLDMYVPAFPDKASMLAQQLQQQSIAADSAAYVGDRPEDGKAADANGLVFVAANWGYGPFLENDMPKHWITINTPDLLQPARISYPSPKT